MPRAKKVFLKSLLRSELSRALGSMKPGSRKKKSSAITRKIIHSREFRCAGKVMAYMALPHEVDIRKVLLKLLEKKKQVFLPAVNRQKGGLRIYRIQNLVQDLIPGSYGILEPRPDQCTPGRPSDLDLILVPGVGFDRKGGRIGHGKGYFDRFLKKANRAMKIGVAFREQMLKKIPLEPHDQRVDRVITD